MCIGIPMEVVSSDDVVATVARRGGGERQQISMLLVGAQAPGTEVLVHLGSAIRVLEPGEGELIERALLAADAAARGEGFEHLLADLIDREPRLPPHLEPTDR